MQTMMVEDDILLTVNKIADQLKMSQQEIFKQAVADYVKKLNRRQELLAFAGILEESEADDLLETIQHSRINKKIEFELFYCFSA